MIKSLLPPTRRRNAGLFPVSLYTAGLHCGLSKLFIIALPYFDRGESFSFCTFLQCLFFSFFLFHFPAHCMFLFLLPAQSSDNLPPPNTSYTSLKGRPILNLWSLEISTNLTLTFEDLICSYLTVLGPFGSLCFLTCVWMGWRKIERTIQA